MTEAMSVIVSIFLTVLSAVAIHASVRYATDRRRRGLALLGLLSLGVAFYFGRALGGFWSGFYTLLAVFMLATTISPWADMLLRERRGR
ncbi:MAG: hypothetical protein AAGB27_03120 [Pseudomonadota bacterium]